ncbi:MAG: hypothetical protein JO291_04015 [Acidimicrobiia bacterium]|nr:hypothetical protein [Acidimicrobiia bacterium]
MQVFELADELGVRTIDVLDACASVGLSEVGAGSELSDDDVKRVRFAFNQREVADAMAQAAVAERSSAPAALPPAPPLPAGAPLPMAAPMPGAPMPGAPMPYPGAPSGRRPVSHGMHPLIKRSLWHLALGQVVPCIGLYFLISSLLLAGKGRRQIKWSGGRYSGDTAGLVVQIVVWAELALMVVVIVVAVATSGGQTPR